MSILNTLAETGMGLIKGAGGALTGAISSGIGEAADSIFGITKKRQKDQLDQQQKLNEQAQKMNWATIDKNNEYNTPVNQVKRLQEAGLNPSLIYGAGPSGVAGGSQAVPSITAGNASDESSRKSASIAQEGMGLQMQMLRSQIDLNNAQADNLKVDAAKKAGVDTKLGEQNIAESQARINQINTSIENLKSDTSLKNSQNELNQLQQVSTELANHFNATNYKQQIEQTGVIIRKLTSEANVSEATQQSLIDIAKENVKLVASQIASNYAGIKLNNAQINQIANNISIANGRLTLDQNKLKQDWNQMVYQSNHKGIITENVRGFTEMIYQAITGHPHSSENK